MGRLEGKVALVTGAASGIGREICLVFSGEGACSASKGGVISLTRDLAIAALFLASDESSYITSADLVVDGGVMVT